VLQRAGLNRVSRVDPPTVIQRYEWPHAGDLLHLDIKPLARIRGVGHRIHGDQSQKRRGVGYEYAHVAIDDATRVAFVEVRRSQRRRASAAFLRNALVWFRRRGITVRRRRAGARLSAPHAGPLPWCRTSGSITTSAPRESWSPLAVDTFPRGCVMNNLF
jgi:hypothetical protein